MSKELFFWEWCRGCPSCLRVRQIGVCSSFMCKISNGFVCKFCLTPLLNARKGIYLPAAYCPGMLSLWISSPVRMSGGHPGVWQMTAAHRGLCVCNRAWAWAAEFACAPNQPHPAVSSQRGDPGLVTCRRGTRLCCHGQAALPAQRTGVSCKIQQERIKGDAENRRIWINDIFQPSLVMAMTSHCACYNEKNFSMRRIFSGASPFQGISV